MTRSFTRRNMLLATGAGAAALAVPAAGAAQAAAAAPSASGQQPGGIALAAPPPGEIVRSRSISRKAPSMTCGPGWPPPACRTGRPTSAGCKAPR